MNNEVKQIYKEGSDIFGLPQIYKGIKFHPLKIMDLEYIDKFYELFMYPKISADQQDPTIFKMSYLKFLLSILLPSINPGVNPGIKLRDFLEFTTKEDVSFENTEVGDNVLITIYIGNSSFNEMEFSNIREIILEQNGSFIEYIEEEYNEQLEKDLKWVHRDSENYTMKDQIFLFASMYSKTIQEIADCTLFQMKYALESMSSFLEFRMQTIPLTNVSENYVVKSYIQHNDRKGRYDEVVEDKDEFIKKSPYFKSDNEK